VWLVIVGWNTHEWFHVRVIFRVIDVDLPDEEEDEDAIIERRRKEREALLQVTLIKGELISIGHYVITCFKDRN